jgi:hypothetical protein
MTDSYQEMQEEIGRAILAICEEEALGVAIDLEALAQCLQQYSQQIFVGDSIYMEPVWIHLLLHYPELEPVRLRSAFSLLESEAVVWQLTLRWPVPTSLQRAIEQQQMHHAMLWLREKLLLSPLGNALGTPKIEKLIQQLVPAHFQQGTLDLAPFETPIAEGAKTSPSFVRGILGQICKNPPFASLKVVIKKPEEEKKTHAAQAALRQQVMDFLVSCLQDTRMQEIIDPEKLEMFLTEELDSFWSEQRYDISPLWQVFADAPGVETPMIEEIFVWIRHRLKATPLPIALPTALSSLSPDTVEEHLAAVQEYLSQLDDVMGAIPEAASAPPIPPPASPQRSASLDATKAPVSSAPAQPVPAERKATPPPPKKEAASTKPLLKKEEDAASPKFPSKKEAPAKASTRKNALGNEPAPLRIGLIAGVGVAFLFSLIIHLAVLRVSHPGFKGEELLEIKPYKEISASVISGRYGNGYLSLRVNDDFLSLDEAEKSREADLLLDLIRQRYRETKALYIFNASDRLLRRIEILPES